MLSLSSTEGIGSVETVTSQPLSREKVALSIDTASSTTTTTAAIPSFAGLRSNYPSTPRSPPESPFACHVPPSSPDYRDAILFKKTGCPLAPLPPIAKKRGLPGSVGTLPGSPSGGGRGRRASAPPAVFKSAYFRLASASLANDLREMSRVFPFPPPPHHAVEERQILEALRHCPPTANGEGINASVLLVDPDRTHHEYLKLLLACHGVSLESGHTGLEALSLMQNKIYHVVILTLDRPLPLLEGLTALSNLRNWEESVGRCPPQPALVLSERMTPSLAERCKKVGGATPKVAPMQLQQILGCISVTKRGDLEKDDLESVGGEGLFEAMLPTIVPPIDEERRRRKSLSDAMDSMKLQGLQGP